MRMLVELGSLLIKYLIENGFVDKDYIAQSNKIIKDIKLNNEQETNAFVSGTLKNGDQVIKGGATKVIEGQLIN